MTNVVVAMMCLYTSRANARIAKTGNDSSAFHSPALRGLLMQSIKVITE
jgi:hypothetical protein